MPTVEQKDVNLSAADNEGLTVKAEQGEYELSY